MPATAVHPLARIREATVELAAGHAAGKIVLSPSLPNDAAVLWA